MLYHNDLMDHGFNNSGLNWGQRRSCLINLHNMSTPVSKNTNFVLCRVFLVGGGGGGVFVGGVSLTSAPRPGREAHFRWGGGANQLEHLTT